MTHYQQTLTYPGTASRAKRSPHARTERGSVRRVRTDSRLHRLTIALATLIQVAVVVLAIELMLGIGVDSQPGPVPAPVPGRGLDL